MAAFEGFKGAVVLVLGFALFTLSHDDLSSLASGIIALLHMNSDGHLSRLFHHIAERATATQVRLIGIGALLYAIMRFVEFYGLWMNRRWAEWFALVSCGVFLPVELFEIIRGISLFKVALFLTNLAIFGYLAYALKTGLSPETETAPVEGA